MKERTTKQSQPYIVLAVILAAFAMFAFTRQSPVDIFKGLVAINLSRSVLITDYIAIGGLGAAFMNAFLMGMLTLLFLVRLKIKPTGATLMAVFLTAGFSLFGKNILNMMPVTFGVWLYSKAVKKLYTDLYLIALLAATISPITSELFFLDVSHLPVNIALGLLLGTLSGFLFPMLSEFFFKVHGGYNLYSMGFVGGILATFFSAFLSGMGIRVETAFSISGGNNFALGVFLYGVSLFLIVWGLIFCDQKTLGSDLLSVTKCSGKLNSDFFEKCGTSVYINMGLLCAMGTSLVLLLGAELNGPSIAGILTMAGFGAYGKHLRNVIPLFIGAVAATQINQWDPSYPTNVLAILFCTGLAPIAGEFGWGWGILAGFLHVSVAHHIGSFSSGLNLYANGFTAGFVALMLIPIIRGMRKILQGRREQAAAERSVREQPVLEEI